MIYSQKHSKHPSAFWRWTSEKDAQTAAKLKAIGIDPRFMSGDPVLVTIGMIYAELDELAAMLPEDDDDQDTQEA